MISPAVPVGEDFIDAIDRTLNSCSVVLALIGPNWLKLRYQDNNSG